MVHLFLFCVACTQSAAGNYSILLKYDALVQVGAMHVQLNKLVEL
jgi:hypothetical protein